MLTWALAEQPPKAIKRPKTLVGPNGDQREDPYYWFRDDKRQNPEVIAHLKVRTLQGPSLLGLDAYSAAGTARAAAQPRRPKPRTRTRAWRTPRSCRRGCMQRCAAPSRRLTRRRLCGAHGNRIGCWVQGASAPEHAVPAARAARAHCITQC